MVFLDAATGEVILNIGLDETGCPLVYFCLYDSNGVPVVQSPAARSFPDGLKVETGAGEVLLQLPAGTNSPIQYRLYNRKGDLLTSSDGLSTKIGPGLRMETRPQGGHSTSLVPWYRSPG